MDMNIYIIWGFLGSGKTTLINYLLSSYLSGKKVVVIENESGTESVDSVLLRRTQVVYVVRFVKSYL